MEMKPGSIFGKWIEEEVKLTKAPLPKVRAKRAPNEELQRDSGTGLVRSENLVAPQHRNHF